MTIRDKGVQRRKASIELAREIASSRQGRGNSIGAMRRRNIQLRAPFVPGEGSSSDIKRLAQRRLEEFFLQRQAKGKAVLICGKNAVAFQSGDCRKRCHHVISPQNPRRCFSGTLGSKKLQKPFFPPEAFFYVWLLMWESSKPGTKTAKKRFEIISRSLAVLA